jgi:hypothetical protein
MSRSRRKTPIIGMTTAPSDKQFKIDEHRTEHHTVRVAVKRSLDSDDIEPELDSRGRPSRRRYRMSGAVKAAVAVQGPY